MQTTFWQVTLITTDKDYRRIELPMIWTSKEKAEKSTECYSALKDGSHTYEVCAVALIN